MFVLEVTISILISKGNFPSRKSYGGSDTETLRFPAHSLWEHQHVSHCKWHMLMVTWDLGRGVRIFSWGMEANPWHQAFIRT